MARSKPDKTHKYDPIKPEFQDELMEEIKKHGVNGYNHKPITRKYLKKASRQSLWRWRQETEDKATEREVEVVRQAAKGASSQEIAVKAGEYLPTPVTTDELVTVGTAPAVVRINQCIARAERLLSNLETKDGNIRNPRMYMAASKHILDSIRTAAQVADILNSSRRVEQFHQAIIDRLSQREPEFAMAVIEDMRRLNEEWMGIV